MRGFSLLELLLALVIMSLLTGIAVPAYQSFVDRSRVSVAVADIGGIDMQIERFVANNFSYPQSLADLAVDLPLDPWGREYQFLLIRGNNQNGLQGRLRKDRNLVPINSDYDLYSVGPDGDSRPPLNARPSRDDIVRAADGGFVGTAEEF